MNAGLRLLAAKELRALWPTCAAAAATVVLTSFTYSRFTPLAYVLGALTLGAQSFGHEYGYRTIGALLMQPVDRRKIFGIKMATLGVMMVLLAAVTWAALSNGRRWDPVFVLALPPLGAFAFGPWLTMLCRNQLAGALFSAVPAGVVFAAAQWIAYQVHVTDDDAAAVLIRQIWFATMAVITPVAALLGWRLFLRLEALEGTGRAIQLPSLFRGRTPRFMVNPVLQLIMKELQLQQIAWVTLLLFVPGLVWALTEVARGSIDFEIVTLLTVIYLGAFALLVGSLASAEERQLGTLPFELMLPMPAWHRWTIKIVVAMTLAVAAAAALSTLVQWFSPVEMRVGIMPRAILPIVIITAVGIYVSSLSTSGVRALALAFPAALAAFLFVQSIHTTVLAYVARPSVTNGFESATGMVLLSLFVGTLLCLGFVNHRSFERTHAQTARQVAGLLAILATTAVLS